MVVATIIIRENPEDRLPVFTQHIEFTRTDEKGVHHYEGVITKYGWKLVDGHWLTEKINEQRTKEVTIAEIHSLHEELTKTVQCYDDAAFDEWKKRRDEQPTALSA
jgi:hypothetical protein